MTNLILVFAMMIVVFCLYGAYSTAKKKKQVYVIYHRITGQILEVFATINDRTVDIDNKRFTLMPDRRSLIWWNRGVHQFFGTWVITYEFSYYSRFPHDPRNYKDTVVSPSVLKVLNNEARMSSFAKGVNNQGTGVKKQGMFEKYLPYIMIGIALILIVLYLKMSGQVGALTTTINKLTGK